MVTYAEDNPFPYITLVDTADPSTPAAGTKRLWVDTDDTLKIIDESAAVSAVGGLPALGTSGQTLRSDGSALAYVYGLPQYAYLASDDAVSSVSFANVTGLSFALVAGARYFFEYFLRISTNATTVGIKLAVNAADAGTTIALTGMIPSNAAALATPWAGGYTFSKDAEIFAMTTGPGGSNVPAYLHGIVTTTTNPDTLQLRHASETATTTTIHGTSLGRITRIG